MADSAARLAYDAFLKEWNNDNDYIVANTSGSTGSPKPIRLPKTDIWRSATSTVGSMNIRRTSIIASALPARSIATKMAIVRSIAAGCSYLPIEPSNTPVIDRHIDLLSVAPSQTDALVANTQYAQLVGTLLVGGAPLSGEREQALLNAGYNVYETYGMTETCSNVALRHCPEPYFIANSGISFTTDCRNCLRISAPEYSFDGIVTNDIVDLLSPHSFKWKGRYDNVINSGGIKLYPEEIEAMLQDLIKIPFYVVGVPDSGWGTAVAVVIEGTEADADITKKILNDFSDHIRRPKKIIAVNAFRYTATGKIIREIPDTTE